MNETIGNSIAWTLEHLTQIIGRKAFAYSNFGYCIRGLVIEKALTCQTTSGTITRQSSKRLRHN